MSAASSDIEGDVPMSSAPSSPGPAPLLLNKGKGKDKAAVLLDDDDDDLAASAATSDNLPWYDYTNYQET
jgi:hypothetical protein